MKIKVIFNHLNNAYFFILNCGNKMKKATKEIFFFLFWQNSFHKPVTNIYCIILLCEVQNIKLIKNCTETFFVLVVPLMA